jgi:hypothetical protein
MEIVMESRIEKSVVKQTQDTKEWGLLMKIFMYTIGYPLLIIVSIPVGIVLAVGGFIVGIAIYILGAFIFFGGFGIILFIGYHLGEWVG